MKINTVVAIICGLIALMGFSEVIFAAPHTKSLETNIERAITSKISHQTIDGEALIDAAGAGDKQAVKNLLAAGVNVNSQEEYGWTALMAASIQRNHEIVELLVSTPNIKIDTQNIYGATALMFAASYGYTESVQILVKAHAKLDIQEDFGYTALMIAVEKSHEEIVEILAKAGTNLNIPIETYGTTALMFAASTGNLKIAKILVNYKADATLKDSSGRTAADIAFAKARRDDSYSELAEFLMRVEEEQRNSMR